MDQNVKPGSKWPTLPVDEKVTFLRRGRDTLSYGRDWFLQQINDEDLSKEWGRQMVEHNPYDKVN